MGGFNVEAIRSETLNVKFLFHAELKIDLPQTFGDTLTSKRITSSGEV